MSGEYEQLKALAREKRHHYGVQTATLGLSKLRAIYRLEGITIDLWELSPRIRAMYMCDGGDPSVLVNKRLPKEPRLFSMVHELKHHYKDRTLIEGGKLKCGDYNANQRIEVGAEVFAAEFIFPEREFLECVRKLGLPSTVRPEDVVRFKRESGAPVSYTFLQKRFEFLGLIGKDSFRAVHFQKLEEEIYGLPIYKQEWFRRRRQARTS